MLIYGLPTIARSETGLDQQGILLGEFPDDNLGSEKSGF